MINENDFPEYSKIKDTYTVECLLGKGSYGNVYRVRHKYMGIQALKIFNPGIISLEQEAELFNEAYLLSKITHPNLVRVFEANTFMYKKKKYYYIAMEYVKGGTLAEYIRKIGNLALSEALYIQKDICSGLSQLHKEDPPIVHRDIKLQNIMIEVGKRLTAKISDFGLVRHVDVKTKISEASGTLFYYPPEAFWNYETTASDVFSAGMVFYIMLTDNPPFKNFTEAFQGSQDSIVDDIIISRKNKPKPPSYFNSEIDKKLDEIALKALEYNVEDRYQNAADFYETICQYENNRLLQSLENIDKALEMGKQYVNIKYAIDLLEKAISQCPKYEQVKLKAKYQKTLENWKKGIIM